MNKERWEAVVSVARKAKRRRPIAPKEDNVTQKDLMKHLVSKVPKGCSLFCIFDRCHAFTGLDLQYKWDVKGETWM